MGSLDVEEISDSNSVISLQEFVKNKPISSIPKHYFRQDHEYHQTPPSNGDVLPITTPTIDMARLVSGEDHHHHLELDKLHSTCKEWGVFQLVNHGVKSSVVEKLKNELEEFYNLPMEERMKYKIKAGEHEGYGNIGKEDGKRDWADRFYFITNPIHRRNPHLLPELPSSLRNILESYFMELQKIAMKLLSFIAKALEIDVNEMIELSENGMQSVRMTYYPPCPNLELAMGFAPHSDATLITILNQVNGVDGLHVNKDGVWLPLIFQPNALVVNIGDILEIFSNGVYHSIEHKATANMVKERITVAFFVNPKFEAEVGPSPSLVNPKNPPLFKRVGMEQYGRDYFVRRPHGKTYLQHMRIEDGQDNLNKTSYIEN